MPHPERWRFWFRWGLSLLLLAVSGVLAVRLVEWRAFLQALQYAASERLWLLGPVIIAAHLLRAWRWQFLIEAALGRRPNLWHAFSAVMIGYAANMLVPRSGELIRPYVLSRREKMPLATLVSGVIVERLFDVLTLVFLLLLGLLIFAEKLFVVTGGGRSVGVSLGVGITVLGVLIVLLASARRWGGWILRYLRRWTPALAQRGERVIEQVQIGTHALKHPRLYAPMIGVTIAMWLLYWAPLYGLFWVFELPLGPLEAFQVLLVSAVAITLAPTPSAAGVYHITVQLALMELFAVPAEKALAYATVAHGLNTLLMLLVGGICWLWEQRALPQE